MEHPRINFLKTEETSPEPRHTIAFRLVITLLILLAALTALYIFWQGNTPEIAVAGSDAKTAAIEPSFHRIFRRLKAFLGGGAQDLTGKERDRINVLLLGQGGPGHDGPYLTDTLIFASIKPSTGQVALLSIPRDMAAAIPGYGWYKINHANSFGEQEKSDAGGRFAADVVAQTLDEPVDYYVRIDFTAFEKLIDEVGGIDIDVERSFSDQSFPAGENKFTAISFKKGAQHMNGDTALKFARSRHGTNGEGSDFARARRQQKVLLALREQLLSLGTIANPARIGRILETLNEHVTTDASITEIIKFITLAQSVNVADVKQHVLTNAEDDLLKNVTENGAFLLVPRSGDYGDIHAFVDELFDRSVREVPLAPDPAPPVTALRLAIYNGTWNTGLATRWQKWLEEQGFAVPILGNTITRPLSKTQIILTDPAAKAKAATLVDVFGVGLTNATSTPLIAETPSVAVMLLLGDDIKEPY